MSCKYLFLSVLFIFEICGFLNYTEVLKCLLYSDDLCYFLIYGFWILIQLGQLSLVCTWNFHTLSAFWDFIFSFKYLIKLDFLNCHYMSDMILCIEYIKTQTTNLELKISVKLQYIKSVALLYTNNKNLKNNKGNYSVTTPHQNNKISRNKFNQGRERSVQQKL